MAWNISYSWHCLSYIDAYNISFKWCRCVFYQKLLTQEKTSTLGWTHRLPIVTMYQTAIVAIQLYSWVKEGTGGYPGRWGLGNVASDVQGISHVLSTKKVPGRLKKITSLKLAKPLKIDGWNTAFLLGRIFGRLSVSQVIQAVTFHQQPFCKGHVFTIPKGRKELPGICFCGKNLNL